MKVSIAMTTYNGEEYIEKQLASILQQSRKADEVIICDDCSTDNTVNIIKEFLSTNNLSNWTIIVNEINIGWRKNFYNTILKTTGDIVFCADQDDIWYYDKIENMVLHFEKNKGIELLAGTFDMIDSKDNFIKKSKKTDGNLVNVKFNEKYYITLLPGCSLCFSKKLKPLMKEVFFESYPHDLLLWNVASLRESAYVYNKPVIKYRIHTESAIKKERSRREETFKLQLDISKKLEKLIHKDTFIIQNKEEKLNYVKRNQTFLRLRIELINEKKASNAVKLLFYFKHFNSYKSYIADLLYTVSKKRYNK